MYIKTFPDGNKTVQGTRTNPAVISDVVGGSKFIISFDIEPLYGGSGTPSPTNPRPISGTGSVMVVNEHEDGEPDFYDIEFGNVGAVYGGTVDFETGTVTLTKVIQVITSVRYATQFDSNILFTTQPQYDIKDRGTSTYTICDKIEPSYNYCFVNREDADKMYISAYARGSVNSIGIIVPSATISNLTEMNSWLETVRPTICYELRNPLVYRISLPEVVAHDGQNTIAVGAESFSVKYSDYINEYRNIRNLSFAPEVDITASEVPINEFSVDVKTSDSFSIGKDIYLYDNHDNVWAKYLIYSADRISTDFVRINALSHLWKLDNRTMYQSLYNEEEVETVIKRIFKDLDADYELDESFEGKTITGYLPQGSARERLHQVCFTIGAYINTCFCDKIQILPIDTTVTAIPTSRVYWRPSVEYGNYITSVQVVYYDYAERYPDVVDEWVEVNGKYYVKTAKTAELKNPNAPADAPENVAKVEDIGIINVNNVDEVLTRLAQFYFQRIQLTADVIDNGEYLPGEKYAIPTGINAEYPMITGFMNSASFTFGHQAKARVTISQSEEVNAVDVIIVYEINGQELDSEIFTVPEGYHFSFENPFIARSWYVGYSVTNDVYRPKNDYAEGTAETGLTHREEYEVALEQVVYSGENTLYINEVDDLEYTTADDANTLTIKGGEDA